MRTKKLIQKISDFLNLTDFTFNKKKRALKELLKKLEGKKPQLLVVLAQELPPQEREPLSEELELLSLHIKKAKNKLELL
jgi:uncharacterized coiled-coil protein SlyX